MSLSQTEPQTELAPPPTQALPSPQPGGAISPIVPRRWSVAEFHRLVETGWFAQETAELLEGEIFTMSPQGPRHRWLLSEVLALLQRLWGDRFFVLCQFPITLQGSEPIPDLAIARGQRRDYRDRHPGPADLLLLIEVADSSLSYDLDHKLPIYARNAIPEVWILAAREATWRVYRDPDPAAGIYREAEIRTIAEEITPLAPELGGRAIALGDLLTEGLGEGVGG